MVSTDTPSDKYKKNVKVLMVKLQSFIDVEVRKPDL